MKSTGVLPTLVYAECRPNVMLPLLKKRQDYLCVRDSKTPCNIAGFLFLQLHAHDLTTCMKSTLESREIVYDKKIPSSLWGAAALLSIFFDFFTNAPLGSSRATLLPFLPTNAFDKGSDRVTCPPTSSYLFNVSALIESGVKIHISLINLEV